MCALLGGGLRFARSTNESVSPELTETCHELEIASPGSGLIFNLGVSANEPDLKTSQRPTSLTIISVPLCLLEQKRLV